MAPEGTASLSGSITDDIVAIRSKWHTKHLQDPALHDRARKASEEACMLRWASTTDTYRYVAQGQSDPLPPSMS